MRTSVIEKWFDVFGFFCVFFFKNMRQWVLVSQYEMKLEINTI